MKKILLSLLILLFSINSFAQNSGTQANRGATNIKEVTEANLPDAIIEKSQLIKQNAPKTATNNAAADVENIAPVDSIKPALFGSQNKNNNILGGNALVNSLLGRNKVVSLMYSDEELADIDRAVESFRNNQTFTPDQANGDAATKKKEKKTEKLEGENEKSYIYLASVMYYSAKDWAVWINNAKITSDNNKFNKELSVKEINRDSVKIVWNLTVSKWRILAGKKSEDAAPKINSQNNVEIEFMLKPNQTFVLGSGRVVEGRAVVNVGGKK